MAKIVYKGVEYTQASLLQESGPALVTLHNQLARQFKVEETARFATKQAGAKRTWSLLQKLPKGEGAEVAAVPVPRAEKSTAPKAARRRSTDKTKPLFDKKLKAVKLPGGRPGSIIHQMFDIVKEKAGTEGADREVLVDAVLAGLTPPRSKHYDRNYVMGYLAHGVLKGFFKEVTA